VRKSLVLLASLLLTVSIMLTGSAALAYENTWITRASMPQAINGCRAAVYDGKIYVIGNSANYMYDPMNDSWTSKTPMPTPRGFFATAVVQNAIYVMGGRDANSTAYSLNEAYYPSNDSWASKKSMPVAGSDMDANVFGQKIYVVWNTENLVYDVMSDSWTNASAMPHPVSAYASAVFQNRVYYFGGMTRPPVPPIYGNYTQIYDPLADTWSSGAPLPTSNQENVAISAVATSGSLSLRRIYVLGGWSAEDVLSGSNVNRVYNPENDSWTFGAPMPTGRVGVALAAVNDKIFAIGGSPIYISSTATNEQYYPLGYGTPDPTPPVPELSWLVIVPFLLIVFSVAVMLRYQKNQ
jgi:N-acetylneuraminic acid mutarotase